MALGSSSTNRFVEQSTIYLGVIMPRSADFSQKTKELMAKKVGYHCSNPFCRKLTIGANADGSGTINIGEAAHITAAEPGGPRYDPSLTVEERKSESNGIWMCRNHAAMIDRDEPFFTVDLIRRWKVEAEKEANERLRDIVPSENLQFTLRMISKPAAKRLIRLCFLLIGPL